MFKVIATVLISMSLLAGCSKSAEDEAGDLVKELEDQGIPFTDESEKCIADYLKTLSGDEIDKLKSNEASEELTTEFGLKLVECGVGSS